MIPVTLYTDNLQKVIALKREEERIMRIFWKCQTCAHVQSVRDTNCRSCHVDVLRNGVRLVIAANLEDAVNRIAVSSVR